MSTYVHAFLLALAMFFSWVGQAAASDANWIVTHTKGRVSLPQAEKISREIYLQSFANEIDPHLVFALIDVESTFNPNARSKAGARGLTQVVPKWHVARINGRNIHDIAVNIEVGVRYLADRRDYYGSMDKALRAYLGNMRSSVYPNKVYASYKKIPKAVVLPIDIPDMLAQSCASNVSSEYGQDYFQYCKKL